MRRPPSDFSRGEREGVAAIPPQAAVLPLNLPPAAARLLLLLLLLPWPPLLTAAHPLPSLLVVAHPLPLPQRAAAAHPPRSSLLPGRRAAAAHLNLLPPRPDRAVHRNPLPPRPTRAARRGPLPPPAHAAPLLRLKSRVHAVRPPRLLPPRLTHAALLQQLQLPPASKLLRSPRDAAPLLLRPSQGGAARSRSRVGCNFGYREAHGMLLCPGVLPLDQ